MPHSSSFPQKKTVVITGASSGIGHASVERLLRAGWQVFATVRKPEDGAKLKSENPGDLVPVIMDVQEHSTIATAAEQVSSYLNGRGLDGLVNVAGIGMVRPLEYASQEDVQTIFDINVFGQLAVTQAFLPLIRQARGRIINITSVGVHIALPFGGLLNGSKSAFALLSDTLRLELHPFGIHVSEVAPGAIKTPAVDKTLGNIAGVISALPQRGGEQYGAMLTSFARHAYAHEMHGSSPNVVAESVYHALTSRHPKARYQPGKGATLLPLVAGLLPQWLLDMLRFKNLGLPSKFGAI